MTKVIPFKDTPNTIERKTRKVLAKVTKPKVKSLNRWPIRGMWPCYNVKVQIHVGPKAYDKFMNSAE